LVSIIIEKNILLNLLDIFFNTHYCFYGQSNRYWCCIGSVSVYGRYISGAHYNRRVTVAMWVNKKIAVEKAAYYIVTQILAGIVASGVYFFIQNKMFLPELGQGVMVFPR